MQEFLKDPDEVLDYKWNWSKVLEGGETISTSSIIVPAGITKDSESNTNSTATVWLSGGTAGNSYTVTDEITTSSSRTYNRSIVITVTQR